MTRRHRLKRSPPCLKFSSNSWTKDFFSLGKTFVQCYLASRAPDDHMFNDCSMINLQYFCVMSMATTYSHVTQIIWLSQFCGIGNGNLLFTGISPFRLERG